MVALPPLTLMEHGSEINCLWIGELCGHFATVPRDSVVHTLRTRSTAVWKRSCEASLKSSPVTKTETPL